MRVTKERLGELLVARGLLKPWQLEQALQEQRATKEFLGALLLRKHWIAQDALLATLAEQFGVPYTHLSQENVDWTVAGRFSYALLLEHHCFPMRMDARSLTAAIADPLDAWAMGELELVAGSRRIQLVLAPQREIQDAIQRAQHYALQRVEEMTKPHERGHA